MATSEFLYTTDIRRYSFSHYTEGSVAAFATQFNTDWAAVLGGTVAVVAKPGAATTALIILSSSQVADVPSGSWIGFNYGNWAVVTNADMASVRYTPVGSV